MCLSNVLFLYGWEYYKCDAAFGYSLLLFLVNVYLGHIREMILYLSGPSTCAHTKRDIEIMSDVIFYNL